MRKLIRVGGAVGSESVLFFFTFEHIRHAQSEGLVYRPRRGLEGICAKTWREEQRVKKRKLTVSKGLSALVNHSFTGNA